MIRLNQQLLLSIQTATLLFDTAKPETITSNVLAGTNDAQTQNKIEKIVNNTTANKKTSINNSGDENAREKVIPDLKEQIAKTNSQAEKEPIIAPNKTANNNLIGLNNSSKEGVDLSELLIRKTDPVNSSIGLIKLNSQPTSTLPQIENLGSIASQKIDRNNNRSFSISVFVSPDLVTANIKSDQPRFREDDRRNIVNNENTKTSFTTGIALNYNINKTLSLSSGLTYFTRTSEITS